MMRIVQVWMRFSNRTQFEIGPFVSVRHGKSSPYFRFLVLAYRLPGHLLAGVGEVAAGHVHIVFLDHGYGP